MIAMDATAVGAPSARRRARLANSLPTGEDMRRTSTAVLISALMLGSASATASDAGAALLNLAINVYDLSGLANPASTVTFEGGGSADAELVSVPPPGPFVGPPGWDFFQDGPRTVAGAFDTDFAAVYVYGGAPGIFAEAEFEPDSDSASASATSYDEFALKASLHAGGSTFTLAPRSELVVTGDLSLRAADGAAGAYVGFAGGQHWNGSEHDGQLSHSIRLVFVNAGDTVATGQFGITLTALTTSTIPEPGSGTLFLAGLLSLIARQRGSVRSLGQRAGRSATA